MQVHSDPSLSPGAYSVESLRGLDYVDDIAVHGADNTVSKNASFRLRSRASPERKQSTVRTPPLPGAMPEDLHSNKSGAGNVPRRGTFKKYAVGTTTSGGPAANSSPRASRRTSAAINAMPEGETASPHAVISLSSDSDFDSGSDLSELLDGEAFDISEANATLVNGVYKSKTSCGSQIDRHVSFSKQVVALMLVPIIFLCVYSGLTFATVATQIAFIDNVYPVMSSISGCTSDLINERDSSSTYVAESTSDSYAAMLYARNQSSQSCGSLSSLVEQSSDTFLSTSFASTVTGILQTMAVQRYRVDHADTDGFQVRTTFTRLVDDLGEGRTYFANSGALSFMSRQLIALKVMWDAISSLGVCYSNAFDILYERPFVDPADVRTLDSNIALYQRNVLFFESIADSIALTFDASYNKGADVNHVLSLIVLVAATSGNVSMNSEDLSAAYAPLRNNDAMEAYEQAAIAAGRNSAQSAAILEGVKLGLAVMCSFIAGVLIAQAQLRSRNKFNIALANSRRFQTSVSKFVPRQFLRLSGCTSILQVSAGEFTEVALAMLFTDIRSFTSIAERMPNKKLFEWLQRQFERMTKLTELHNGFVDKFIGDAVFSVFMQSVDAIECGIAMQASMTQLNADIVAANGDDLVHIGVGIHHAVTCLGFLGDDNRISCTLISSQVNLASRLEGLTKFYGAKIIVSDAAFAQLGTHTFTCRKLGTICAKGSHTNIDIIELFQADPLELKKHKLETKGDFEEGVALMHRGESEAAAALFQRVVDAASRAGVVDAAALFKLAHRTAIDTFDEK